MSKISTVHACFLYLVACSPTDQGAGTHACAGCSKAPTAAFLTGEIGDFYFLLHIPGRDPTLLSHSAHTTSVVLLS